MTDEYPYGDTFSIQPLVDRVTVEKKVFDVLQKNNLDLMAKLDEAIETLKEYARSENWKTNDVWYNVWYDGEGYTIARECLNSLEVKYDK